MRGTFDTPEEALQAFNPDYVDGVYLRTAMVDYPFGDWHGTAIGVVFDLAQPSP